MSTPQSQIYVCAGVPLNNRYEHTIYFETAAAQTAYFTGKVKKGFNKYTFLRKSWSVKVESTMAAAISWCYAYVNNPGMPKRFYYFITNIEYVNDTTVELFLELDVLQTYMFDYELLPCFVERQHVQNDTIGAHTLDEGLELGDLKTNFMADVTALNELCILVLTSVTLNGTSKETTVNAYSYVYGRTFSGLMIYAIPMNQWANWSRQLDNLSEWGKLDGIVAMWMYPKNLVKLSDEDDWNNTEVLAKVVEGVETIEYTMVDYGSDLDGYTPKNNKLYTYPYNFLYLTNNNGGSAIYRYERFAGETHTFNFVGALAPDAGVKAIPIGYNLTDASNQTDKPSYHEGLNLGAFPSCAWDADVYKIWLAQNQNAHQLATAQGVLKIAGGVAGSLMSVASGNLLGAGAGVGTAVSGLNQISNLMAAKADMEVQPPQARSAISANINVANNKGLFTFYWKSVSAEYAKIIDNYFTMYGYKLNNVQTPQTHARPAFTYVKTIGCHIAGDLCTEDMNKIESIFDKGITFWVDGDKVGDYTQDNNW